MAKVNQRMRELRERNHYTIKEMSDKLGVSVATAQRYESDKGIKTVPYEIIEKAAKIFDVEPSYIMGWSSDIQELHDDFLQHQKTNEAITNFLSGDYDKISEKTQNNTSVYRAEYDDITTELIDRLNEMSPRQKMKVVDAIMTLLDSAVY